MADEAEAPLRRNGEGLGRGIAARRSGWANARELRRQETPAEIMLWARLRRHGLGVPFRRQHPIGPFIVDFHCPGHALIVELDGGIHERPDVREQDRWREGWLTRHGFRVVRFPNEQVLDDMEGLLSALRTEITARRVYVDRFASTDK